MSAGCRGFERFQNCFSSSHTQHRDHICTSIDQARGTLVDMRWGKEFCFVVSVNHVVRVVGGVGGVGGGGRAAVNIY